MLTVDSFDFLPLHKKRTSNFVYEVRHLHHTKRVVERNEFFVAVVKDDACQQSLIGFFTSSTLYHFIGHFCKDSCISEERTICTRTTTHGVIFNIRLTSHLPRPLHQYTLICHPYVTCFLSGQEYIFTKRVKNSLRNEGLTQRTK